MPAATTHDDFGDRIRDPGLVERVALRDIFVSGGLVNANRSGKMIQQRASELSSSCLEEKYSVNTAKKIAALHDPVIGSISFSCDFHIFGPGAFWNVLPSWSWSRVFFGVRKSLAIMEVINANQCGCLFCATALQGSTAGNE
jgi:hypothetical protein